jgi:hypothetical protein
MSLADRKPPSNSRVVCHVCHVLEILPPTEAEALRGMLDGKEWRSTWIADALREEGHEISDRSLTRHRLGRCRGAK